MTASQLTDFAESEIEDYVEKQLRNNARLLYGGESICFKVESQREAAWIIENYGSFDVTTRFGCVDSCNREFCTRSHWVTISMIVDLDQDE